MKQWKRLAALSSAVVMAAATLTYFPSDTLQNIRLELSASAGTTTEPQVWKEDNLTWTLDADGMLTISGTGAMKDYDYYYNNSSPVCENSNVKKVVIEDGVTSIGNWAFCNCTSLTDITIPDSVTSIGDSAFYGCDLTSITIPSSVTSIGDSAFESCTNLTDITIPDSVTSIGNSAFTACWKLISITIPDSVTSIGDFAFYACGLTSITIPSSVTSIGDSAFESCTNLTDITIPDSVTSIGAMVFVSCTNLQTISLSCKSSLKKSDFGDQADLVSASHTLKKTEAKDATCSESGNKEYWTCEHCGKYFLSDDANLETAKAVEQSETVISASHKLTKVDAKDATCTEDGNKEYWTCEHCKQYFLSDDTNPETATAVEQSETVIPASHKLTKVKEEKAPACSESGNKEYWTCEHCGKYFLSDDTNPETAKAVELSETILPALKHKNATTRGVVEPTETEPGYSGDRYCPDCDTVLEKGYTYWNEDNLTWTLDADGMLTISGTGAMKDYDYNNNPSPVCSNSNVKKVVIKDGVTSIGSSAFDSCSNLTSITIPDSVTSIGNFAFYDCSSLPSITIPDSVTSIGYGAFSDCSSLTSITIPDGVTSIGDGAFYNCTSLTSITIPDSVTSIGNYAFDNCTKLKTISLGCGSALKKSDFGKQADLVSYTSHILTKTAAKASCTENGNKEYWTCEHCGKHFLSDDANPETAKAVEQSEFIIPASHKLTKVEAKAPTCTEDGNKEYWTCEHCGKYFLSDDTNPETAKAVEQSEFIIPASHKLTKVKEEKAPTCSESGNKEYWTCEHCGKYFLSDDTNPETAKAVELSETILPALKHKNAYIRDISKPTETAPGYSGDRYCPDCDTVLEKGYTYWNEDNLTWKLDADGTLTISGTGAMKNYNDTDKLSPACRNSSVKKVVIEDGVTSIGDFAFYNYTSLTSITIPDSVTSIGNFAVSACWYLTSITIPDSVTSIGNSAFVSCIRLTSITIPDSVTSIGNSAFYGCNSLISITIPDSVTSIGIDVFQKCTRLKTISLSCKSSLKKSDFGKQANLVSYTNQHALTKTAAKDATCSESGNKEYWTCEHCGKYFLSDDTNPETAKAVEQSEFIIPASHKLTKVDAKAPTCTENGNKEYWTCEHCKKYFLSDDTNPETAKAVEQSEFIIPALNHKNATTRGVAEPTETAPGYSGDLYCPDCDTVLEKGYTYWNEGNLTWKLDADGTMTISGTGAMKDYDIENNKSPVYMNSKVKKVVIEDGVTSIGNYAFSGCLGLKSITIPDGITSIGDHAFDSCINLRSITLPDSITSIGMRAFYNCWNVPSIIIPDGVTNIEDFTFDSCISLTSITIPNSVTNIKSSAFHNCADLTSITIPDSVTSIGDSAFSDCGSLTTISLSCGSALKKSDFGEQADLVSYTNQHALTKTAAKTATCTEDGNKAYWTCEHCKKYFLSDDANPETAKAVEQAEFIIPASHKLTKVEAKAPTCAENGNKAYWTCEHCGKYFLSDDTNPKTAKAVEQAETVIPALKHKNATTRGVVEPNGTKPGYSGDRYCPDCDTVLEKGYTYWNEDNLTWKLDADGTLTISGTGTMKDYDYNNNPSPANQKKGSVKKVVIKDGVTSIGNFAFYNCKSLTSITIPDSVTSIELAAFNNCSSLTSITIPDSVTSIGDSAFELCNKLSSITLSNNITSIGNWAFHGCPLTSITIPDSVTSIGAMAFYSCSNLQTISLSCKSSLKKSDFGDKANLVSYTNQHLLTKTEAKAKTCTEDGNKEYWTCEHCGKYFLSDDANPATATAVEQSETIIPASHKLTKVEAKAPTCTEDGNKAYWTCEHCGKYFLSDDANPETAKAVELSETVIPASHKLTKVEAKDATCSENGNKEYWICEHCKQYFLSDDTNPETAKAVELSETILPAIQHKNAELRNASEPTETAPGYSGDRYCPDCDKVVEKGYTYWNEGKLTWKLYEDGTLNISGTGAMKNYDYYYNNPSPATQKKDSVKKVVIEDGVTSVGDYAFYNCSSLTSITIPKNVTSIGNSVFENCSSLTDITIPDSVTSIGDSAFSMCIRLTSITIPDSVTSIGEWAFHSSGLTSITLPSSVTNIGKSVFNNCMELTSITIPESVTNIEDSAFAGCLGLTSITIPNSVTSIGDRAFINCNGLTSITIPDSVTIMGESVFYNCSSLTDITIPDSVTSIGNSAFYKCSSLTSITIPDSVTSIGKLAFSGCSSLKTISLSCGSALKKSDFGDQADLVSYTNQHLLTKTAAKAKTCTEDGNKEYWTCEHCKKYFLSDDTNPETAKAVEQAETIIPASHELTKVEAKDATCTEDGNIEYWQCDVCKKTFTDEAGKNAVDNVIIAALKHSYNENGFCENDDTHYQPATYNEEIEKYEISNAGQLYWFAEQVNSGNASVNAVLTTDIVVNEGNLATYDGTSPNTWMTWTPIGNGASRRVYSGTFDGQGHTISGLYVNSNDNYIGLFGVVMSGSNIKNIGVINSYFKGNDFVGGIAGTVNESSFVQNCYSINTISGNDYIGGICGAFGSNNTDIKKCYAVCNIHPSEKATHVGGVIASGEYVNISDCYYDSDIFSGKAYTDIFSSVNAKNVEGKTTAQFASGEVTYLLNDDQSNIIFYQDLATEKYPTLNQKSKVVMQLEMIYDESFGEDATTKKTYHNAGDTIALETSPDKAYTYQYFVDGKQIEEPTYTLTGNTKMTVKSVPVEIELSEIDTIQLTYQKKTKLDLTVYIKNFADLKPMQFQLDADSKLPEGLTLEEDGILSGIPEKAAENVKTTLILTAKNGTTKNMELTFHIAKAEPTVEVTVNGDSHTEGDLVSELELILSENSTKGVVELVSEIKALVAGKNTLTWKFTPEDENNYHTVTGTVVVNAQTTTTTTTTTKATTTTTKATTTTKPNKTTTTKATTTTKPSKTTTTKVTTTTKPSKTTTTKATTTTKPSKTTTTKVTTTTKPSKTTTTKATTTTKPSKTTTTKATTTTKPSKTTTTKVTTTTKPNKTTTTKVTTTTKPSKTTTTNVTTTTKPSKTTTTKVTTTTKPSKTTTTKVTTTTKPSKTTTTNATTTNTATPFYGDVNLDGKVDILDAVFLNKYLATLVQFSDAQMANADCCQDGVLNDQDTIALMHFIILLIDNLPV